MKGMLRWLASNLGLMILSLALSLLLWIVAVEQENPTMERRYSVPIPVTVSQPPEGTVAFGQTDVNIIVTLRAPESVWGILQPEDIHATANLDGLGPGTHRVPIELRVDQGPVMVRRLEPDAVTINIEPLQQAEVPINILIAGDETLGYEAQTPVIDPSTVTVSGPSSMVTQVVEAAALVVVEGARADIEGGFDLEPRNSEGELVPYVTVDPDSVAVIVPVVRLAGFQDLVVSAVLEGQVAPGYSVSSINVDPPMVMVFGRQDVIDQIPGYLETTPLNLEGARRTIEVELPLVIPEGVSAVGIEEPVVTVSVNIAPLEGSITVSRTIELQGLTGITATVAPKVVDVILSGPLPVLEELDEEDVRVFVDLAALNPGSHSVEPLVVVVVPSGEDISVSVLPASVQVEITALLTPTPDR
jgi:YbbR domain-containing protein